MCRITLFLRCTCDHLEPVFRVTPCTHLLSGLCPGCTGQRHCYFPEIITEDVDRPCNLCLPDRGQDISFMKLVHLLRDAHQLEEDLDAARSFAANTTGGPDPEGFQRLSDDVNDTIDAIRTFVYDALDRMGHRNIDPELRTYAVEQGVNLNDPDLDFFDFLATYADTVLVDMEAIDWNRTQVRGVGTVPRTYPGDPTTEEPAEPEPENTGGPEDPNEGGPEDPNPDDEGPWRPTAMGIFPAWRFSPWRF